MNRDELLQQVRGVRERGEEWFQVHVRDPLSSSDVHYVLAVLCEDGFVWELVFQYRSFVEGEETGYLFRRMVEDRKSITPYANGLPA